MGPKVEAVEWSHRLEGAWLPSLLMFLLRRGGSADSRVPTKPGPACNLPTSGKKHSFVAKWVQMIVDRELVLV